MKTSILFVLALSASVFAQSQPQPTKTETKTTDGKQYVVSVGQCAFPTYVFDSISSNFSYTVCQEHITANYTVTGSGWNSTSAEIPGTASSTYSLEQKENGNTMYIGQDQTAIQASLNFLSVQSACQSLQQNTSGLVVPVSQTPCAGQ